ncbi:translation initiation factor IF-3 [Vulcaniibacterium gelatinicum]|uniref:translation initiation factor IF-3 n=1 Tax=Vulcaniibacterium gelatinicum TaxID=2598725 RepID=UPI0011CB4A87|nr:translation initiation factor IF-3 [Vulcaniibacterium gelatinicum]
MSQARPPGAAGTTHPGDRNISTLEKQNRRNHEIRVPRVRVIGADGEMIGVLSRDEALRMAEEAELDLVEIQPNADPPVCRIMDFGKFKFEQQKKAAAAKKKQKQVEIKEVKFRPVTDEGDYQIKLRNMRRFLEEGDKVKVNIRFRGREMSHQELGRAMAQRIEADLGEDVVIEQRPRLEGRQMVMMIAPKKK